MTDFELQVLEKLDIIVGNSQALLAVIVFAFLILTFSYILKEICSYF